MTEAPQTTDYSQRLQQAIEAGGVAAGLQEMESELRTKKLYHELFEVLKMTSRFQLGLPLVAFDEDEKVDEKIRNQLDERLLESCREVGTLFLKEGHVQEGWMYLRPTGDLETAANLISQIELNEENLESVIAVLLSEGVDPKRGFQLVLEHYGTCNAITTFEGEVARQKKSVQSEAAMQLVGQLHAELKENLRFDWEKRFGSPPPEGSFADWLAAHPEMVAERAYHIDTSHLSSVVRFAKLTDDLETIEKALDLADYGAAIDKCYHYEGEEPFTEHFDSHRKFFLILLGRDVDACLDYFRARAEAVDVHTQGTMAAETYIDLLSRVGRLDEAIDSSIKYLAGRRVMGIAPPIASLCQKLGSYEKLIDHFQSSGDVLGVGTGMLLRELKGSE